MSDEVEARGWDTIDGLLGPIYGNTEPLHWAPVLPAMLGGSDPLQGISAYRSTFGGRPHWHFVTYGFSELYEKESDDPEVSGFGFELTVRVVDSQAEIEPPMWVVSLLQNIARYVFRSGNWFDAGHYMTLNGPIALGRDTELVAAAFIEDPQLGTHGPVESPNGSFEVLQLVGLTNDEYEAVRRWDTRKFLGEVASFDPALVTDLSRRSWLRRADLARAAEEGTARDGSSMASFFASKGSLVPEARPPVWSIAANCTDDLRTLVRGRLDFGRTMTVYWPKGALCVKPGSNTAVEAGNVPTLTLSPEDRAFLTTVPATRGDYPTPSGMLVVRVLPVEIFDGERKQVLRVIG